MLTIIQARCGSSRLPCKVLKDICGRPMIWHVIQRAKTIGWPVVVATTWSEDDDDLACYLESIGQQYFCGPELDVLRRFVQCVEWWEEVSGEEVTHIARVTGDSPLLSLAHCRAIGVVGRGGIDLVRPHADALSPANEGVEVMSRYALDWLVRYWGGDALTLEHITPRAYMHQGCFVVSRWEPPASDAHVKLSVDTQSDLDFVRGVYDDLWLGGGHLIRQRDAAKFAEKRRDR